MPHDNFLQTNRAIVKEAPQLNDKFTIEVILKKSRDDGKIGSILCASMSPMETTDSPLPKIAYKLACINYSNKTLNSIESMLGFDTPMIGFQPLFELFTSDGSYKIHHEEVLPYDKWVNLTVTYDGNILTLYIDGKKVEECNVTGNIAESNKLCIGATDDTIQLEHFSGGIKQIAVFPNCKTPEKIEKLIDKIYLANNEEGALFIMHPHYDFDTIKDILINDPSKPQVNDETIIWRYMSLSKFASLILSRALFFTNADEFDDSWECYPVDSLLDKNRWLTILKKTHRNDFYKFSDAELKSAANNLINELSLAWKNRGKNFSVSCWHMHEKEAINLWKVYCNEDESVAVKTTIKSLRENLNDDGILITPVSYVDFTESKWPLSLYNETPIYHPAIHKKKELFYEKELRAIIHKNGKLKYKDTNKTGVLSSLNDINDFIHEVVLSPKASPAFKESVKTLMESNGVDSNKLKKSIISYKPPELTERSWIWQNNFIDFEQQSNKLLTVVYFFPSIDKFEELNRIWFELSHMFLKEESSGVIDCRIQHRKIGILKKHPTDIKKGFVIISSILKERTIDCWFDYILEKADIQKKVLNTNTTYKDKDTWEYLRDNGWVKKIDGVEYVGVPI